MADPADRFFLAALVHNLGRNRARHIIELGEDPRTAYLRVMEPSLRPADIERHCRQTGIEVLLPDDPAYPALLRPADDAPPVLYARGETAALLRPTVAVVGARRCTRGGREVAARLAADLARRGVCIVSGLARGIDTAAHRAALAEGITAAVVGSGLARPYPGANRALADAIAAGGGLLLSEYPPWHGARKHHFPERNRLISGVALGVVVVEAGEQSGSLITARLAAEQGREVCAVPGPVTHPLNRGCHRLIKQGAALVENADDVLEALGLKAPADGESAEGTAPVDEHRPPDETLASILAQVEGTLTTLDEIVAATGVRGELVSAALVELELSGFVRQVPGGYIRRPLV